jgi:hypothetical protein
MVTPPDWIIRRDVLKAAQGAPFHEYVTVYAPPLEWSSDADTIHGARIRPVLLGNMHEPPGWVLRLDYVDAPIRVYVHWLWWRGCEPSWFLLSPSTTWGDVSTPHSSVEVGAWRNMEEMRDLARIQFPPLHSSGLTDSVRKFDRITAAIARVIEDGYDYDALCAALKDAGAGGDRRVILQH